MDKHNLKLIHKNLKSLLNALEAEIYSEPEAYTRQPDVPGHKFWCGFADDDDGYAD